MIRRAHRFLLRLWGTRDARCRSFPARCRIVWGTTWRHCWSYPQLREALVAGRGGDGSGGERGRTDMVDSDWTPIGGWDLVAAYIWPGLLTAMAFGAIVLAAIRKGDF